MPDRWTEQGGPVPLADCEQCDLQIESQKFLHDHLVGGSTRVGDCRIPGLIKILAAIDDALSFSG